MSLFHCARLGIPFLVLCSAVSLRAAAPTLSSLFPAGGQKGSAFTLATTGKGEGNVRCWTDAPGVNIHPEGKAANQWKVTIAADSPAGLYQIRLFNHEGVSEVRWFRVGSQPEISEIEPNDENGKGQLLGKLPVCINARLEKSGDVDGYRISLKKGQILAAHIEAYALGSPVDMIAHIVSSSGTRLLTASDDRNLDPAFTFTAPEDGEYTVQLAGFAHPPQANVAYAGGNNIVYRLQLTTDRVVNHIHPAAVTRIARSEVALHGQGDPLDQGASKFTIEPSSIRLHQGLAWLDVPGAFAPIQAVPTNTVPTVEKEPNQQVGEATPVKPGDVIGGHIMDSEDTDRFTVDMKKGQRMQVKVHAKALGSPLDATLQVLAPDGKSIAAIDDLGDQFDPAVQWTATSDGAYQVVLSDTLRQGGAQNFYTLVVAPPMPSCQVTLAGPQALTVAAGKTATIKASIKLLNGLANPLVVRASNLPIGVYLEDIVIPEKGGEVEIKLTAASDAEPCQQPFQIAVWTKGDSPSFYPAVAPLRGESLRGTSLLDSTTDLWLTVTR